MSLLTSKFDEDRIRGEMAVKEMVREMGLAGFGLPWLANGMRTIADAVGISTDDLIDQVRVFLGQEPWEET